jgi:putative heme-binding domain-containing protein
MIGRGYLLGALLSAGLIAATSAGTKAQTNQSEPVATKGDAAKGQAVFEGKGNCLSCHRVADHGSHLGPDLSSIGKERGQAEIQKELLYPLLAVPAQYQLYRVTTQSGQSFTGRLMNQDRRSIQLLDSTDRLRSFLKNSLRDYGFIPTPPMPSYRDKLTPEEAFDVTAYLMSLKGIVKQ